MRRCSYLFALSSVLICVANVAAQEGTTTDGHTVTYPAGTPAPAIDAHPQTVASSIADGEISDTRVVLNFDALPASPWVTTQCQGGPSTATAAQGILTVASASCMEFSLRDPDGLWHRFVDNARGWIIETSLKVDPATTPQCDFRGSVQIWAHDHTNLLVVGFSPDAMCLAYPDNVRVPMNTTDSFHVYRIVSKGRHVQVYVDGALTIDHTLSWSGGGTVNLMFGDGVGGTPSLTRWDYFSYDVLALAGSSQPNLTLTLTGCVQCRAGDPFRVQGRLRNPSFRAVPVEIKGVLRVPGGAPITPPDTDRHTELVLPPLYDATFTLVDMLWPAGTPAGAWTVQGTLVEPVLGGMFSQDVQPFTVLP